MRELHFEIIADRILQIIEKKNPKKNWGELVDAAH